MTAEHKRDEYYVTHRLGQCTWKRTYCTA